MSNSPQPPINISDDEKIARVVFSPLMVDDGALSPSAFFLRNLRQPEDYVSVFRSNYFEPTRKNVSMIHAPEGNDFYGYALLNVGICRSISFKEIMIDVLSHPTANNPFHAGIHYSKSGTSIKGRCTDPDFIVVATMLANNSELKPF